MKAKIDKFLNEILPSLTKEESDLIEDVIKWSGEEQAAFIFAKRIFEEKDE